MKRTKIQVTSKGKMFLVELIIKHPQIAKCIGYLRRNNTLWAVNDLEQRKFVEIITVR